MVYRNKYIASSIITSAIILNNRDPEFDWKKEFEDVYNFLKSFSSLEDHASLANDYIKNSVKEDYIMCLEDGERLKMLKPHLERCHHMTPEQYRAKWNLPHDYPMVAPSYSRRRSEMAKDAGLGTFGYGRGRPKPQRN